MEAEGGAGCGGGGVSLAKVVAVEEPWQSMYMWSLFFVKTMADVRLFDPRTIRLFEVWVRARACVCVCMAVV